MVERPPRPPPSGMDGDGQGSQRVRYGVAPSVSRRVSRDCSCEWSRRGVADHIAERHRWTADACSATAASDDGIAGKPAAQKQLVVEGPRKPRRKTGGGRRLECRLGVHSSAAWLTRVLVPADDVRDAQGLPSRPEGLGLPRRLEEFELRATITDRNSLKDVI